MYLLISFRKSTPLQKRPLNVLISNSKKQVDDLVGGMPFWGGEEGDGEDWLDLAPEDLDSIFVPERKILIRLLSKLIRLLTNFWLRPFIPCLYQSIPRVSRVRVGDRER